MQFEVRRPYVLLTLCLLGSVAVAAHNQVLPMLARPLVCNQLTEGVDAIAISYGDRRYDLAAEAIATQQAGKVLLFHDRERWSVKVGAAIPLHEIGRQQLQRRQVASECIQVLEGTANSRWEEADRLAEWLAAHPDATVTLYIDRFHSREARVVLDRALSNEAVQRVHVNGLRDRRFDESNWWRSRIGWRELFNGYVVWGFGSLAPRPQATQSTWNPASYEASLRQTQGGLVSPVNGLSEKGLD